MSSVKFRPVLPKNGLIGFASMIIDDWLVLNNIAVFTRKALPNRVRLVFPERSFGDNNKVTLFHPLSSERYYMMEDAVLIKVQQQIWN